MEHAISLNAYSYNNFVSGTGGKLYVPVKPSSVVYAQFDHISGVAARANQDGISVTKIQILNSLINQLVSMGQTPKAQPSADMSNRQVDSLIAQSHGSIQDAVHTAQMSGYGLAGAMPQLGVVLSVSA